MKKITLKRPSFDRPLTLLWLVFGALTFYFFYIWHLGNLTAGHSAAEVQNKSLCSSLSNLVNNPIDLPHHLLQFLSLKINSTSSFWLRFPSVIIALIFVYVFYRLAKLWFGRLIALLGAVLFATTPWIVLLGRSATSDILLLAPLGVLACYIWFVKRKENKLLPWLVLSIFIGSSLYVPGVIYFLIMASLIDNKRLRQNISELGLSKFIAGLLLIFILIAPLIFGLSQNTAQLKELLLVPQYWTGITDILKTLGWTISSIFWRTQGHVDIIIDRIPLLNWILIAFMIFGIYILWKRARQELYLLASPVIVAIIGAALNHNLFLLTLGVPSLCIIATAGMRYLYMEWREIFPRNPIANLASLVLLIAVVLLNVLIGARYALIAWPHTTETKNVYVLK